SWRTAFIEAVASKVLERIAGRLPHGDVINASESREAPSDSVNGNDGDGLRDSSGHIRFFTMTGALKRAPKVYKIQMRPDPPGSLTTVDQGCFSSIRTTHWTVFPT